MTLLELDHKELRNSFKWKLYRFMWINLKRLSLWFGNQMIKMSKEIDQHDQNRGLPDSHQKRFKERFGLDINRHDIRELVNDIQEGNNILSAKRLTSRVTAFNMNFKNMRCVVLYDKNRKVPVTVLTPKMEVIEDESDWC